MKYIFSLLLISCFLLNSCKTKEDKPTAEEAKQFATAFEKDAESKQMNLFEKNILIPAMMDRINSSAELKSKKFPRSALQKGVTSGLKKHNYETMLYQTLGTNGHFTTVKHYEKDGKRRVILRAYGSGGINYFDIELTKIKDKVGIADVLLYTTGSTLSATMGEMVAKLLDSKTSDYKGLENAMKGIQMHVRNENYEKAKELYDQLPDEIKNTQVMESVYLGIVPYLSGNEYDTELNKLEKKYADEPASQLMLMDLYLIKKDYDKALRSIDMIDTNINSDPFLHYYRGLIYNMKPDNEKALEHFEKAAIALPNFPDNLGELFIQHAVNDNREMATKYFKAYKALKNHDPEVVDYYKEEYPYLAD